MTRRTTLWLIAALLGIVASAAVAWTASQLAGQRIGLSSAPPSVVRGLAPASPPGATHSRRHSRTRRSSSSHGFLPAPLPPVDDSSGSLNQDSAGPDD